MYGSSWSAGRTLSRKSPYNHGGCPIRVLYRNTAGVGDLHLGETWCVLAEDVLLDSLREWLSTDAAEVF